MKKILLVIIILAGNWSTAQIDIRYKFSDGQVFSKQIFDALVKTFDKQNLEYKITDSVITTSTLTRIVDIKTKGYYAAKENNTVFDPYATFKLNKGKEFKISDFLDE